MPSLAQATAVPSPAAQPIQRPAAEPPARVSVAVGWQQCEPLHSLIAECPDSTFFHSAAWARVLIDSYGHTPIYFYRARGDRLDTLLPLMEVASPWTGRRGVSLPFSDLCGALKADGESSVDLFQAALEYGREQRWRYLECRGEFTWPGAAPSLEYYGHTIDLQHREEALFENLDAAARRGVRKAEREGLRVEFEVSPQALRCFYDLHCGTRRRHGLPPQPWRFFKHIGRHVLETAQGVVATARLGARPIAAAVFAFHRRKVLYKFGASDHAFQHLRPNNLVMWEAIRRFARGGCTELHLGRTSLHHDGLRRFKLGLGAQEQIIKFYKYNFAERAFVTEQDGTEGWFNHVFRRLPQPLLRLAGEILYPHLA